MKITLVNGLIGFALFLSLLATGLSMFALQRNADVASVPDQAARLANASQSDSEAASTPLAPDLQTAKAGDASPQATIRLPRSEIPATKEALESEATFVAAQLVDLLPNQAISLHVLAMLKAQLHQTAEAEELWQRCIELDAASEPYYVNLAAILLDRGKSQEAVEMLQKAVDSGIKSYDISHHLGLALNSTGQADKAIEVATAALEFNPNTGSLWLILGQAQLKKGLNDDAETSLRRAIELGVNSKAAYFALFNACMRLGKRDEASKFRERYAAFQEQELPAEERYQRLSEAEARRVCISILSESATIYSAIPDTRTSEHLLLRVLALEPENRAACEDLAKIYSERGEVGNEIAVRERIVELDSLNLMNYLRLAKAYVSAGSPQDAEAQIKMAISFSPQMVKGYAAMTDFLMEQNKPAEAQWYVEQAIRLKPTAQGFELLAKTLDAQGKSQEAKAARGVASEISRSAATGTTGDAQE